MTTWTKERIEKLPPGEIKALRKNANDRGVHEVVAMCDEVLGTKVKAAVARAKRESPIKAHARLISRRKAFEMRGVKLHNPRWSWGAIRKSDGMPVLTIWKQEIRETVTGFECLLWGPDRDGSRPWADKLGGRERHRHCILAAQRNEGEGVLIYGARRGKDLPADEASIVEGADPHAVIRFRIEVRGEDYWAVWDKADVFPPGTAANSKTSPSTAKVRLD